jgi:basic membrane lipoprotein Med (substrate-binding protein (PBP1-ABC) superfamily)
MRVHTPVFLFSMLIALAMVMVACGGGEKATATPAKKVIVGAIHVGAVTDAGYNQAQHDGLEVMKKNLPEVQVLEAENVPESADAERVMENMIQQGATIIFPQSFGYLDPALNVAKKYPNVTFVHPAGFKLAPNLGTYWAQSDKLTYLMGVAAGKMTKTNKLGFIGGFPIPNIIASANAFQLGARSVNPNVQTFVIFNGTWLDPAKEAASTNTLGDQGVDVVTMIVDSPITVVQTAEKRAMYTVGFHSVEVQKFAPNYWISGIGFTWGGYFTRVVKDVEAGTWKSEHVRGGIDGDFATLAPWGPKVPNDVKQLVDQRKQELLQGTLQVFKGPMKDNKGELRIKEGEQGDPNLINTMDWFVEGVTGRTN